MSQRKFPIPESELSFRFSMSGGPGGQHANKSNTRVELVWEVAQSSSFDAQEKKLLEERLGSVVRIVVTESRSQIRNRELAYERLEKKIEEGLQKKN